MAALTFTIPAAALAVLDAYAQKRNFADFRAFEIERLKTIVRRARIEQNEQQAKDALAQPVPDVNIT